MLVYVQSDCLDTVLYCFSCLGPAGIPHPFHNRFLFFLLVGAEGSEVRRLVTGWLVSLHVGVVMWLNHVILDQVPG